jgi:hypothetical protein
MLLLLFVKGKGVPRQAEVALGVPGRLRPRIISTFGRQPYAPAAFTPGEFPGTHFQRLSWPQGTWFSRREPRKKSPVSPPGIDPGAVRPVAQRLNHYATPGPIIVCRKLKITMLGVASTLWSIPVHYSLSRTLWCHFNECACCASELERQLSSMTITIIMVMTKRMTMMMSSKYPFPA